MNNPVQELNQLAAQYRMSTHSFLALAQAAAEHQKRAVTCTSGPHPQHVDEYLITKDVFDVVPEWAAPLFRVGGQIERLHWPDGTTTVRLVDPRGLVLANVVLRSDEGMT